MDEHYYEAPDAFIRHIDPSMKKRCMQWAEIDGRKRFMVAGKVNKFIPNPTFDPIAKPGSLEDYFRGRNLEGRDIAAMFGELDPLDDHPGFRDRDARVALMDRQGLESVLLFPTQGVGMQEALKRDIPALHAAFSAFNMWLDEDWGFDRDGRIFAAPMLTFADPELAVAELERLLGMGGPHRVHRPGAGAYRQRLPVAGHGRLRPHLVPAGGGRGAAGHARRAQRHRPVRQGVGAVEGPVRGVQAHGLPAGGLLGPLDLGQPSRP